MSDSLFKMLVIAALAVTLVLDYMDLNSDTEEMAQIAEMDGDVDQIAEMVKEMDADIDRMAKSMNVGDGDPGQ